MNRNVLTIFALATFATACVPHKYNAHSDKNGASDLTSLEFNLPDPSSISANASQHLTHFQVKLTMNECDKVTNQCTPKEIKNDIIPYTKLSQTPEISLQQGNDYMIYLAVGKANASSKNELGDVYYESSGGDGFISADSFKGKAKLSKTFYLKLTSSGQKIGLPETKKEESVNPPNTPPVLPNTPTPPPVQNPPVNTSGLKEIFSKTTFATAANPKATIKDAWGNARYLIVDFSFFGCPPCRNLMSSLNNDPSVVTNLEKSGKCKVVTAVVHGDAANFRTSYRNVASHVHGMDGQIPEMIHKFGAPSNDSNSFPNLRIYDAQKNGGDMIRSEVAPNTDSFKSSAILGLCR